MSGQLPAEQPQPVTGRPGRRSRWWWIVGVAIAAVVVIIFAPLASQDPDGLTRIAEDQGFIGQAENFLSGLLGGYEIPGVADANVSKVLSGLLGIVILVVLLFGVGKLLARRRA